MRSRLAAALAAVFAMLSPVLIFAPASADDAVQRLGACLAGGGQGDLLIVMDASASLRESDPDNHRVEAAGYLLEQLATFVDQTDASIDVALAGFAHDFEVSQDWTALDPETVDELVSAVSTYATKNTGWETDYWVALNGARSHLREKAGNGDCQALVWLSDGMFDLDARDSVSEQERYGVHKPYGPDVELTSKPAEQDVERAGKIDLCRTGGVADALRTQGVTTLAIGLQQSQPPNAFNLMKGVATGAPTQGKACGARNGSDAGVFVLAESIGDLFFAFDELADPEHSPISQTTPLCQAAFCPEGTHQFVLDPSISSVRVLAGSDLTDFYAVLVSPDGQRRRLQVGEDLDGALPAATLKATWLSEGVFALQIDRVRDRGWSGAWQVAIVDPSSTGKGSARSNIRLYGDLEPTWPDARSTELVAGQKAEIKIGLQRSDGSSVEPRDLNGDITVDATLMLDGGGQVPIGADLDAQDLRRPLIVNLAEVPSGGARLNLAMVYTTADAGGIRGTTLEPQAVDFPVRIAPPPDYPTPPRHIDFGFGETTDPVTVSVPLSGKGCAWLGSAETLTLPEGLTSAPVSSSTATPDACQAGELSLTLTPNTLGSGLVSGRVTLMTRAEEASAPPIATTVPFTYEMERPLNQQVFWFAFPLVLLTGLLLPLLLLMLVKWWTSRIPGQSLSLLSVSGPVHDHGSFLDIVVPDPQKISNLPLAGADRRSVPLNATARLKARPGLLRLTEPGHVVVVGQPATTSSGTRLPLAVQDRWVALLDPLDPHRGPVQVVLLLSAGAERLNDLLADARANVPDKVRQLRSTLGPAPTGAPPQDGFLDDWGAPSGGSSAASSHDNW